MDIMSSLQVICVYTNSSGRHDMLVFGYERDKYQLPLKLQFEPVPSIKHAAMDFIKELTQNVFDPDISEIIGCHTLEVKNDQKTSYYQIHFLLYNITNHVDQYVSKSAFLHTIDTQKVNTSDHLYPRFTGFRDYMLLKYSISLPVQYARINKIVPPDWVGHNISLDVTVHAKSLFLGRFEWEGKISETHNLPSCKSEQPVAKKCFTCECNICVVCMQNARSVISLPCKHMSLCSTCTKAIKRTTNRCPVCRAYTQTWIEDIKFA